jgi:hypothetical protein
VSKLNNLSIEFLRVYRKSLTEIIIIITTAYLTLEYFSQHFRYTEVVMLIKLKKIGKIVYTSNAYRSIALLSAIGKIIKKIMNDRIAAAAERHNLLS